MKTAPRHPVIGPSVFQQIVEQVDLAVSITDLDANILYVNPAFTRITGYEPAEAIGHNESMLSHKVTPPALYRELWKRLAAREPWTGRLVNRRADGAKYLAELMITPVLDERGEAVRYLGLHRDVTGLHRLECEARNQKALIESVVDAAPLAMALLDGDHRVVLDNQEYKKLMGDLGMVEPAAAILDAVRADMGSPLGVPKDGAYAFLNREVRIDTRARARWFSCSGTWMRLDEGSADSFFGENSRMFLLLAATETTEQRAQQEKARLAALRAMLAEEGRINALRETLAAAVFQLEGPVNMMGSVLGTMERRGAPAGAALGEALGAARAALDSLRRAMPADSGELPTAVNINEALHDVLELATPRMLALGVHVAWRPQAVLPAILGYPNRLRAMLKALVDNAVEALNTRGWRERELVITSGASADAVEVAVRDSGPGLPASARLKAFEPFFTTKKEHGHLGTGLPAAQQVAQDHGGSIALEAAPGGGCLARVVLPLKRS
ncbi:MAG TPA: nitrogen fixation negative regulator NifL [Rhodocyclaceae bacterium]